MGTWCNYWKKLEVRLTNLKFWSHILIHLKWFCKKLKRCHLFGWVLIKVIHPGGEIPFSLPPEWLRTLTFKIYQQLTSRPNLWNFTHDLSHGNLFSFWSVFCYVIPHNTISLMHKCCWEVQWCCPMLWQGKDGWHDPVICFFKIWFWITLLV